MTSSISPQDLHPICKRCIPAQRRKLAELGQPFEEWMIPCHFISKSQMDPHRVITRLEEINATDDEKLLALYANDPNLFCEQELSVTLQDAQEEALLCTSKKQVLRMARRYGKTFTLTVYALWWALTHPGTRIILFAPFDNQVERLFIEICDWAKRSQWCREKIVRVGNHKAFYKSSPLEMKFENESIIIGKSLGTANRESSTGLRGEGVIDKRTGLGGLVIGDEIDYLTEKVWAVIDPIVDEVSIITGKAEATFIAASTPSGARNKFYNMCKGELAKYYKELHRTIYDRKNITQDEINKLKANIRSEDAWEREYMADFGEEVDNVFRWEDLIACQAPVVFKYHDVAIIENSATGLLTIPWWDYSSMVTKSKRSNPRIMGIDWNGPNIGTRFIIIEYNPKAVRISNETGNQIEFEPRYQVVGRYSIPPSKFSNTLANDMVLALNRIYEPDMIYADAGYGDMQVESLHRIGVESERGTPEKGLETKVKSILMQGYTEVWDRATEEYVKKENKPFMIDICRGFVEQRKLQISSHEYNMGSFGGEEGYLIQNLLQFKVKKIEGGRLRYSADNDHDSIALSLAMMGFVVEMTDVCQIPPALQINGLLRETESDTNNWARTKRVDREDGEENGDPLAGVGGFRRGRDPSRSTGQTDRSSFISEKGPQVVRLGIGNEIESQSPISVPRHKTLQRFKAGRRKLF